MFRKKECLAALLAGFMLLTGCTAQTTGQAKLLQEEVKTTSANLKTVQVTRGTLQREFSMNANVVFPDREVVRLQADEAQYVEHQVIVGQEVKKGDVIAVFRKQTDDIRLTAIELELEQLEAQRQDGLDDRAEQMECNGLEILGTGNEFLRHMTEPSVRLRIVQIFERVQKVVKSILINIDGRVVVSEVGDPDIAYVLIIIFQQIMEQTDNITQ